MVEIWQWEPNSGQGVTERLSWYTSIASTRQGKEERQRRREHPRRQMEFSSVLKDSYDQRLFDAAMSREQATGWIMPIWWDACQPGLEALTGNIVQITGSSPGFEELAFRDWKVGQHVVLRKGRLVASFEISEVTSTYVRGTPQPSSEFFASTDRLTAWPAWEGVLAATVTNPRHSAGSSSLAVSFELQGYESPDRQAWPTQYAGLDLYDEAPGEGSALIGTEFQSLLEIIDGVIGPFETFDVSANPFVDRVQRHLLYDRERTWRTRRWWQKLGGAAQSFWCPTWHNDLSILGALTGELRAYWGPLGLEGEGSMVWPPTYSQSYGHAGRDRIYLRRRGESPDAVQITGSDGAEDNYEILTTSPTLPDFSQGDVIQCSWLEPVRMASDDVTIQWVTPEVGIWQLATRMIDDQE